MILCVIFKFILLLVVYYSATLRRVTIMFHNIAVAFLFSFSLFCHLTSADVQ